jgi:hypothetical protein
VGWAPIGFNLEILVSGKTGTPLPLPRPVAGDACGRDVVGGEGDGDRRLASFVGGGVTGEVSAVVVVVEEEGVWYFEVVWELDGMLEFGGIGDGRGCGDLLF